MYNILMHLKSTRAIFFFSFFVFFFSLSQNALALTWTATNSGNSNWADVTTSDDGSVVAVADSSDDVIISLDYGQTWSTSTPTTTSMSWSKIDVSADGSTVALTGDHIYISTNTGSTWTEMQPAGTSTQAWWGVEVSDDGSVMLATIDNSSDVYVSTTTGSTWYLTQPTTTVGFYATALSSDGSTMAVAGDPGFIYTSTDYGQTWTPRHTSELWWEMSMSDDGSKIFAVDLNDTINISSNSGVSWSVVTVPDFPTLSGISNSADGTKVVLSDLNGELFTSTSTGQTWTRQLSVSGLGWDLFADSSDDGVNVYTNEGGAKIWRGRANPPAFSGISTTSATTTAAIDWTTDLAADATVNYGTTISYGQSATDASGTTSHSVSLSGLDSCTTYHYQLESTDSDYSQVGTTSDATFGTAGDCFGSNPAEVAQDIADGQIVVVGGVATNTPSVTFNIDYSIVSGSASIKFSSGTQLTNSEGGNINFLDVTVEDVTSSLQGAYVGDIAGAVSVGLVSADLSFTQNATITIPVSTSYNGQTLNVYSQGEGASTWTLETACLVTGGLCVFVSNHATYFSAGDEPQDPPSSSGGGTKTKRDTPSTEEESDNSLEPAEGDSPLQIKLKKIISLLLQVIELQKKLLELST